MPLCELLVRLGADKSFKSATKASPVHFACCYNRLDVAKYFIDKNDLEIADEFGDTPLVRAASCGCTKVFDYLVELSVSLISFEVLGNISYNYSSGANVHAMPLNLVSPLMLAAQRGDSAIVRTEASPPKFFATDLDSQVERLLRLGVNVDAVDKSGRSALFYACRSGFLGPVKLLVETGHCSVTLRDRYGNDAAWNAESRGMYEVVMYLFSHGSEISEPLKSRGFGSEVHFKRLMHKTTAPTPRSTPLAALAVLGGKRVLIAGGHGYLDGKKQENNLAALEETHTNVTGSNGDLYCPFVPPTFPSLTVLLFSL